MRIETRTRLRGWPPRVSWWFALRRVWPLRVSGAVILGGGALALWFGRSRMDLVLTLAGLFALVLGALLLVALACRWLALRSELRGMSTATPRRIEGVAGREIASGFNLVRRRWPLVADPRWVAAHPPAAVRIVAKGHRLREWLGPSRRALGEGVTRDFVLEDLLGFWRLPLRSRSHEAFRIHPDTGQVSRSSLETCLASGDLLPHPWGPARGDRVDQRPYTRSDPARLILWKVYARSRQLLVRTAEPARSPIRRPLLFLAAGTGDEAAAGTARLLFESGLLGQGARLAADGTPEPVQDDTAAADAIARSSIRAELGGADLERALASREVEADDPVILVCSAAPGTHLDRLARCVARQPARFLVLCAADVAPARGSDSEGWRRLILTPVAREGLDRKTWLEAAERFARLGARAAAVDRTSGELVVSRPGERRSA